MLYHTYHQEAGFPHSSVVKESVCNAGDHVQFLDWEDLLEKEMAKHSCILAWRIPWTEEPGRVESTGHRVGHNLATKERERLRGRIDGPYFLILAK